MPARTAGAARRNVLVLEVNAAGDGRLYTDGQGAAPIEGPLKALAAAHVRLFGGRELVLRLPEAAVFHRTTNVPARALPDLRRILELEIDQATPFALSEVEFDFLTELAKEDRKSVCVRQTIVKKTVLDSALHSLGETASSVARVDAIGAEGINLLRRSGPSIRRKTLLAAAALIVACAAALAATEARQARIIAMLETERNALETQTADARAAAADARAAVNNSTALNERISSRPSSLEIISTLTQLLPDDAWLMELSVRQANLSISGYARSASGIIAAIEASDMFENVETVAPITADPTGDYERYSLKFAALPRPSPEPSIDARNDGDER